VKARGIATPSISAMAIVKAIRSESRDQAAGFTP
jgi:hypothetical protein